MEKDADVECNLTPYLEYLSTLPMDKCFMPYQAGHSIRMSRINFYNNYQPEKQKPFPFALWRLIFTRFRPDVPGIAKRTQVEVTPLKLEEDEYVAEDTIVLYDPELNYLVVQRNRTGAPPSFIRKFFNCMGSDESAIELQIVTKNDAYKRAAKHFLHHTFNLRFKNIRNPRIQEIVPKDVPLVNLLNIGEAMASEQEYPIRAELLLTIPTRKPTDSFKHQVHSKILSVANMLAADAEIDKLKIKGRVDEESSLEEVDLIDEAVRDFIKFDMKNVRFISSERIFDKIALAYAQKRTTLISI